MILLIDFLLHPAVAGMRNLLGLKWYAVFQELLNLRFQIRLFWEPTIFSRSPTRREFQIPKLKGQML